VTNHLRAIHLHLQSPLEGHYVLLKPTRSVRTVAQDVATCKTVGSLASLMASLIQESDLPFGHDRGGLLRLYASQFLSLARAIAGALLQEPSREPEVSSST
jgi:hypothetical protein